MTMTPRVNRYVWLLLAIVVGAFVLFHIRGAIFPFIVGGALAYILHPLVALIEKLSPWRYKHPELSRVAAILIVFAIILTLMAGSLAIIIPPAVEQFRSFMELLPELFSTARATLEAWSYDYADKVPEEIRLQIEAGLENAGSIIVGAGQNVVLKTVSAVSSALTIVIGLAIVPLFLFYALKDREAFADGLVSWFPASSRVHARNTILIVNHVLSSYIRAQLFLGLVVGVLVFIGLTVLGVRFAIILGILAGLFEMIPIIGPWLGAIPGVLVVLATSPEDFVWVVLMYLGIQLLENTFLVPRIQSQALHVHPVIIMAVLVIGSEVAGLWGVVLGPPLVAGAMEVITYFRTVWNPDDIEPASDLQASHTPHGEAEITPHETPPDSPAEPVQETATPSE